MVKKNKSHAKSQFVKQSLKKIKTQIWFNQTNIFRKNCLKSLYYKSNNYNLSNNQDQEIGFLNINHQQVKIKYDHIILQQQYDSNDSQDQQQGQRQALKQYSGDSESKEEVLQKEQYSNDSQEEQQDSQYDSKENQQQEEVEEGEEEEEQQEKDSNDLEEEQNQNNSDSDDSDNSNNSDSDNSNNSEDSDNSNNSEDSDNSNNSDQENSKNSDSDNSEDSDSDNSEDSGEKEEESEQEQQDVEQNGEVEVLNQKQRRLFKKLSKDGFSQYEIIEESLEVSLLRAYQKKNNRKVIIQVYHSYFGSEYILSNSEKDRHLKILKVVYDKDKRIDYIILENYKQSLIDQIDSYYKTNKSFSNQDIERIILSIFNYFQPGNLILIFGIENVVQLENRSYTIFDFKQYSNRKYQLWKQCKLNQQQNNIYYIGVILSALFGYPIKELKEEQKYKHNVKLDYSIIKNLKHKKILAFLQEYVFDAESQFAKVTNFIIQLSNLFTLNINLLELSYYQQQSEACYQLMVVESEQKTNCKYSEITKQFEMYYDKGQNKEISSLYAKSLIQWNIKDEQHFGRCIKYYLDQKQYEECLELQKSDYKNFQKVRQLCVTIYCYLKLNDIEEAKQVILILAKQDQAKFQQILQVSKEAMSNSKSTFIQFQRSIFHLLY